MFLWASVLFWTIIFLAIISEVRWLKGCFVWERSFWDRGILPRRQCWPECRPRPSKESSQKFLVNKYEINGPIKDQISHYNQWQPGKGGLAKRTGFWLDHTDWTHQHLASSPVCRMVLLSKHWPLASELVYRWLCHRHINGVNKQTAVSVKVSNISYL